MGRQNAPYAAAPPRTGLDKLIQGWYSNSTDSRQQVHRDSERPGTLYGSRQTGNEVLMIGSGRQVLDVTFYQSELRQKLNSVVEEIRRLQSDIELTEKENTNYNLFESKADGLASDLRNLQAELGDYNTLIDKLHTETELEDFEMECVTLKALNNAKTQTLDGIFLARQQRESAIKELEKQIEDEKELSEKLIINLPPSQQDMYHSLKKENIMFLETIEMQRKEYESIQTEIERTLSQNSNKKEGFSLYQRLTEAKSRRADLELSAQKASLESGQQEKCRLLEQVKSDNLEISGMERKIAEIDSRIKEMVKDSADADEEFGVEKLNQEKKYNQLVKKDEEMSLFLDSFDTKIQDLLSSKSKLEMELKSKQESIDDLSKKDNKKLPSKEEFSNLNRDLAVKKADLAVSDTTADALKGERIRRLDDLEKIEKLEIKLSDEIRTLNDKIAGNKAEIIELGDIEEAKVKSEARYQEQQIIARELAIHTGRATADLLELEAQFKAKQSVLSSDDTYNQLNTLELRVAEVEGLNSEIREYISSKTIQSDYGVVASDVLQLMAIINGTLAS